MVGRDDLVEEWLADSCQRESRTTQSWNTRDRGNLEVRLNLIVSDGSGGRSQEGRRSVPEAKDCAIVLTCLESVRRHAERSGGRGKGAVEDEIVCGIVDLKTHDAVAAGGKGEKLLDLNVKFWVESTWKPPVDQSVFKIFGAVLG